MNSVAVLIPRENMTMADTKKDDCAEQEPTTNSSSPEDKSTGSPGNLSCTTLFRLSMNETESAKETVVCVETFIHSVRMCYRVEKITRKFRTS